MSPPLPPWKQPSGEGIYELYGSFWSHGGPIGYSRKDETQVEMQLNYGVS